MLNHTADSGYLSRPLRRFTKDGLIVVGEKSRVETRFEAHFYSTSVTKRISLVLQYLLYIGTGQSEEQGV
jgi:hypothetical protein